jgi:hypothetical protein
MTHRKLTDRQRLFAREYLVDLNATRAAIRAGYSQASASQRGWALRRHPEVAARIEAAMADRSEAVGITAERVLCELARLGFANIRDYFDGGGEGAGWLDPARLTREQAAELIGRHLGLFPRLPDREKAADRSAREEAKQDDETGEGRVMSDMELAQRILDILVGAEKEAKGC